MTSVALVCASIHGALDSVAQDVGGHREWRFGIQALQVDADLNPTGASGIESHDGPHLSQPGDAPALEPHRLPQTGGA